MAFKSTFICPFCFEKHKLSEAQFRCTNQRCEDVPDPELTRYENGDVNNPMKRKTCFSVQMKGLSFPRSGECPKCHSQSYAVVCPSCHNKIPESTLLGKDMIISVVGARGTGKSHFVGVIIEELITRIAGAFDGSMVGFDDTTQRYASGAKDKLYTKLEKLELTNSSIINTKNGAYKPLIYTLQLGHKTLIKDMIESYTLVFFDTAGEDLDDEDIMSTVNKHICKSSGIIFLLDPMQIPAVRNQLDDDTVFRALNVDWTKASRSDDIMSRVSNLIRHDKNIKSKQKIKIPVAAVFSKFDAIMPLVPEGSTILETSPHCKEKCFDKLDGHNVDLEIKGLLREWGEDSFVKQVGINYSLYSFFAVSALGINNNPQKDSSIERPRPHRIEDPLLWILKENGIIKESK